MHIQGEKMKKVDHFKYLGTVVSADGSFEKEVRRKVQAGWQRWRRASGVLCDRKLSARMKGKMYKSVVRPAMLYGMETVVKERMEKNMEVAELNTVRWALGVTFFQARKFDGAKYLPLAENELSNLDQQGLL